MLVENEPGRGALLALTGTSRQYLFLQDQAFHSWPLPGSGPGHLVLEPTQQLSIRRHAGVPAQTHENTTPGLVFLSHAS